MVVGARAGHGSGGEGRRADLALARRHWLPGGWRAAALASIPSSGRRSPQLAGCLAGFRASRAADAVAPARSGSSCCCRCSSISSAIRCTGVVSGVQRMLHQRHSSSELGRWRPPGVQRSQADAAGAAAASAADTAAAASATPRPLQQYLLVLLILLAQQGVSVQRDVPHCFQRRP